MPTTRPAGGPFSGRKAQAAHNDLTILDAARTVFMRDPAAPISAVAAAAGVGVSALYRRYASKDELLQTLCADGLRRFIHIADVALAEQPDPWDGLAVFIRDIVDADVHSLTVHLAGTFPSTPALRQLVEEANKRAARVFRRARISGAVRADLHLNDLVMLFEQLAAIRLRDADRSRAPPALSRAPAGRPATGGRQDATGRLAPHLRRARRALRPG